MDNTDEKWRNLIERALANQASLNDTLRPDWRVQGWKYYRAVWTEIAEAIMHTNWAWWKGGNYNKPVSEAQMVEVHIELCDIFHFGMSMDLLHSKPECLIDSYIYGFRDAQQVSCTLDEDLEAIVVDSILLKCFNVKKFARACSAAGLDLPGLMALYFGKSTLNSFRWRNGYNEKTYTKMWRLTEEEVPREDNTHLAEYIHQLSKGSTPEALLDRLLSGDAIQAIDTHLENTYARIIK